MSMHERNEDGYPERNYYGNIKDIHSKFRLLQASYEAHKAELANETRAELRALSRQVPVQFREDILLEVSDAVQIDSIAPDHTIYTFDGNRIISYSFPNEQIQP